jgi:hypothetical protein
MPIVRLAKPLIFFAKSTEHPVRYATNPIVARLSLQILEILKQCNVSKDIQDKVGICA